VTEEDKKRQAAVLASIADQLPWTTIEEWNAQRFSDDVLRPVRAEIRASFYIPDKPTTKH
jgi:hypothetical protein